jgi:hypothetical protein
MAAAMLKNKVIYRQFAKKLFTSKLISRNVKLQLYNTVIRPTVTYASKTWVLKENMINKLMIFERKVMMMANGGSKLIAKSMIYEKDKR